MADGASNLETGATIALAEALVKQGIRAGGDALQKAKERFDEKRFGFLGPKAKDGVKRERESAEFSLYKEFMGDKRQEKCFLAGRYLRTIAKDFETVESYRRELLQRFKLNGLHIAQAVEAEVLPTIRGGLERFCVTSAEFHNRMVGFFQNVSSYILFVQEDDDETYETENLRKHLKLQGPPVFIVAGSGKAVTLASNIAHTVKQRLEPEYGLKTIEAEGRANYALYLRLK